MTRPARLLIVEDDESLLKLWSRDVEEFNKDQKVNLELDLTTAQTKEHALKYLEESWFDYVIVDLRIPEKTSDGAPTNATNGNELLDIISKNYPVVVAIMSGHVDEAKDPDGINVKRFTKGTDENRAILNWFYERRDLAQAMSSLIKRTQSLMANFFHLSAAQRWERDWKNSPKPDELEEMIMRMGFAHLSEQITHTLEKTKYHPEEFYLFPSVREKLHTGDLIRIGDQLNVVLTPPCDMANTPPPAHILVAICTECTDQGPPAWKKFVEAKEKDKEDRMRDLINQNFAVAQHFLPPLNGDGPWILEFKGTRTIDGGDKIPELIKSRVASISPYFLSNLLSRFASYIGRPGQPNISPEISRIVADKISAAKKVK